MRRLTIVLALAALAGCGGSDEPLTHDEFVAKADDICAEHNAKIEDALSSLSKASSRDEIEQAAGHYVDLYEDMTEAVTELEPPQGDRAVAQYLDRLERNARGLRKGADDHALLTERFESTVNNSLVAARDRAEAAGLRECSSLD